MKSLLQIIFSSRRIVFFQVLILLCGLLFLSSISSNIMYANPQEEVLVPTDMFPTPGKYYSEAERTITWPSGVQMKNLELRNIQIVDSLPAAGDSLLYMFDAIMGFDLSLDGGMTFQYSQGDASLYLRVKYLGPSSKMEHSQLSSPNEMRTFNVIVLQMNISGGMLPPGIMIRESPTLQSIGELTVQTVPDGYRIDSFFDIFTELSLDGGETWSAANDTIKLLPYYPPESFFDVDMFPPDGEYKSNPGDSIWWANGVVIKNVVFRDPSPQAVLPLFGSTQAYSYDDVADFEISIDGGGSYTPVSAPCAKNAQVYHYADDDDARFFDIEILAMNITGGSLPAGIMIRESPTRGSKRELSVRVEDGGYGISSFFDVFTELSVDGGQTWLPGLGKPLYCELSRQVEIDTFPQTIAQMTLQYPDMSIETIYLTGPTTVVVDIQPDGTADDTDGDGLDDVTSEMISMTLTGSGIYGPVVVKLDTRFQSIGEIEEIVNNTPGKLDIPPFVMMGAANSFFDVFVEIEVAQMKLYNSLPARMVVMLKHKPPLQGETYALTNGPIPLVDGYGMPTGVILLDSRHTPNPIKEIDYFPNSFALVEVQFPDQRTEMIHLTGPTTVEVITTLNGDAYDYDGDGLDQVPTEMVQLDLHGNSAILGDVTIRLRDFNKHPFQRTTGEIEETANMTPNTLDLPPFTMMGSANSFFDVFFEIDAGGIVLHNSVAKHMNATITHKPPAIGEEYADDTPIDLLDEDEQQTGIRIIKTIHIPDPGEIDYFMHVKSLIELHYPDQSTEIIKLRGKSLEHVVIPPGGSADDSDGDGLDDVETEMLQLELIGSSTIYGDVKVRLRDYTKRPWQHTLGMIEEMINNTMGTFDLPPFTVSGTAQSFFDVFFEINLGGIILNNMEPKRIQEIITHKPPAEDETYEGTTLVTLFDTEGIPSGIQLGLTTYTPNPGDDTISTQVAQGWNMVSIPVTLDDYLKTVVYPTAISNAFAYEGGTYKTKDTLDNGPGYWVKFSSSQTIDYIGDWRALDTIDVAEGWNMIGSISDTVEVSEILSIPSGIITSQFFGYDKGYVSSDIIAPGKAYWVKVTQAGQLILQLPEIEWPMAQRIRIIPINELPPPPPSDEISSHIIIIPTEYKLEQNYPNPFNPTTVISYQLPVDSWVVLKVYNVFGQEVKTIVNEQQSAGFKSIKFNTIELASGVYYYKLTAGSFTDVRQMILMK